MGTLFDVEIDPNTALTTELHEEEGRVWTKSKQDISDTVKYAEHCRNEGGANDNKEMWRHYAIIPEVVQLEMHHKGIPWERDPKLAVKYINQHHPHLKVTSNWEDSPRAGTKDHRIIVK